MKPMSCQREGCNALVHHLCQGAWERQNGYDDTVARLCYLHHPDYKYVGTSSKVSVAAANAQNELLKAKVVNVDSHAMSEGIDCTNEELEEASKVDGSDVSHDDPSCFDSISDGGMGGALMTMKPLLKTIYSLRLRSLITPQITTTFTSVPLTSWSVVQLLQIIALLWRQFT